MLRVILSIVFLLFANCLPLQSQDQERRVVSLRFGFAADGPIRTFSVSEGVEATVSSRRDGTFRFTPVIGEDSEIVVTISDADGLLIGAVNLPQTDECRLIETDTSPPVWIGIVTDECEVIETGGLRIDIERD